ncbi:hypothetical protein HSBGL_2061 [Halapricum desulfuricans]|uniref:Uncharacterized protein n=1 Tax=Halapricum desulfuricans TaxID=2841257 RepID=A0A897NDI7_9EURY|nr:hypothetical protein HSBGL_2061 [Halapricum desulfuricans]
MFPTRKCDNDSLGYERLGSGRETAIGALVAVPARKLSMRNYFIRRATISVQSVLDRNP